MIRPPSTESLKLKRAHHEGYRKGYLASMKDVDKYGEHLSCQFCQRRNLTVCRFVRMNLQQSENDFLCTSFSPNYKKLKEFDKQFQIP